MGGGGLTWRPGFSDPNATRSKSQGGAKQERAAPSTGVSPLLLMTTVHAPRPDLVIMRSWKWGGVVPVE
ncbi:MAG: hypothetical protein ACK56I_22865, partial [bacterium]